MIYKSVKFNIFQKKLTDMIFGKDSKFNSKNRFMEKSVAFRISREIILKPLNPKHLDNKKFAEL